MSSISKLTRLLGGVAVSETEGREETKSPVIQGVFGRNVLDASFDDGVPLDDHLGLSGHHTVETVRLYAKNPLVDGTHVTLEPKLKTVLKQLSKDISRMGQGYEPLFMMLETLPSYLRQKEPIEEKQLALFEDLVKDLSTDQKKRVLSSLNPETLHVLLFLYGQTPFMDLCEKLKERFPGLAISALASIPTPAIKAPPSKEDKWSVTYKNVAFPIKHIDIENGRETIGTLTATITFNFYSSTKNPRNYNGVIENTVIDATFQAKVSPTEKHKGDGRSIAWNAVTDDEREGRRPAYESFVNIFHY